jgi:short-subunit dehydrogenase
MIDERAKGANWKGLAAVGVLAGVAGAVGWRVLRRPADHEPLPRGRALITGASSGIGQAFARRLAAQGFDLTLVARREERLRSLAAELSAAHGIRAEALAADLAREEEIDRVAQAVRQMPDLVLLINNAGFGTRGDFAEVALERHLDMIRVHDVATVCLTWAAVPGMVERGRGAIINVSSIAAFFPSGGGATYTATKAYLNNFSEALAAELQGTGVKVQALCPGFTTSEFHDTPEYEGFNRGQVPGPLWMSADAVAEGSLAALASDDVIVVPGRAYRGIVLTANSPLRGAIRRAGRAVRRRWHAIR